MMATMLIMGGMLLMLAPLTDLVARLNVSEWASALRRAFPPAPDTPEDMVDNLHKLERVE